VAELVVVYKAIAPEAQKIAALLQRRHLHPVFMDEFEATGGYRSHDRAIQIGVPATERDMAVAILAEAEQQSEAKVAPTVRRIQGVFLLVGLMVAVVILIGVLDRDGKWLVVVTAFLGLFAAVLLLRWGWGKRPED